jgi:hypothetical protein
MFRIFVLAIAVALVFAKDWTHYTRQNEVRDVILAEGGTLWAAFAWGLQERLANKTENTYMPGSNNLEATDFVQVFALSGGDIIAASKNGILVRKNKGSMNFETISGSYLEKKRELLPGLGKKAENILILPFKGALAFFDYEQNRSVITLSQIKTSSLESSTIERVAVKGNTLWVKLPNNVIWKREIDWKKIYDDRFLADPNSWEKEADAIPFTEEPKPAYTANISNFPLERVRAISVISGGNALAWGNDYNLFSRMQNGHWGEAFASNQSGYGDDQKTWPPDGTSMAMLPNGSFAVGMWGPGLIAFNAENAKVGWYHSTNSGNNCPTGFKSDDYWTIVQGVAPVPDFSGFLFSYVSENKDGLGFVDNNRKATCAKSEKASSSAAFSVIAKKNETQDLEIYAAWKSSLGSREGGIDFYIYSQNSKDFSPVWQKGWALLFGSPIDFAFDSKGVLWAVSLSKIFYLDKNGGEWEWKEPSYIRGFGNGTISSLETDAQNGLWVGTTGDGAYVFSQINNSPDSLTARHFKIKDGLLNETIFDIAIDTIKGKVYFAHDLGLSVYSTALVRNGSDYMQGDALKPFAYPNPFRPSIHSEVKIDYINEKSSVYILDSSGKRVRFFKGNDLRGGMVVWDGKNENGKLVAPGLYYYLAANGKDVAKGKIIVER